MCGRFALATEKHLLELLYDLEKRADFNLLPRYNIAPGQNALILRQASGGQEKELALLKWGLVPFWAQDPARFKKLINARAETLASKPSFKEAYKKRRALVPVSGFYEWKEERGAKQPYYITRRNQELFSVAALWEKWQQEEERLETFTIITTAAKGPVSALHTRMPAIISKENYACWLSAGTEEKVLQSLLQPAPAEDLYYYAVSKKVNSPLNDESALLEPL